MSAYADATNLLMVDGGASTFEFGKPSAWGLAVEM